MFSKTFTRLYPSLALVSGLVANSISAQTPTTLRQAADNVGLHIGAAVSGNSVGPNGNATFKNIVSTEFNSVVCENDMKLDVRGRVMQERPPLLQP